MGDDDNRGKRQRDQEGELSQPRGRMLTVKKSLFVEDEEIETLGKNLSLFKSWVGGGEKLFDF